MKWLNTLKLWLPPMPATPPRHKPDRSALLQLAGIIAVALLMHLKIADFWIGGFAIFIFLIKVMALYRDSGPPNKFIIVLLTIISLGMVIVLYGGWNGQRAGISFLVLLVTLKYLESEALRDYFVVCLILYFLAASSFLFDSSIFNILIVTAFTLAITSVLFQISNPSQQTALHALKQSANIVVRALPLALLLFFLFPRVHGSFGFIPSLDKSNSNSLSDALVAGEMAQSAFNEELAFRVNFRGNEIPARRDLYWRVKTMPIERDFTWEVASDHAHIEINKGEGMQKVASMASDGSELEYTYSILHEQTSDLRLPYLDYVAGAEKGRINFDYSVLHNNNSGGSFNYLGRSTLEPSLSPNGAQISRDRNLGTTSQPTARLLALLNQFRQQASTNAAKAELVYDYIANNNFTYSLTPPSLGEENLLDRFLFDTKTGYCEHFASAYTILMRWLGVPARIVVGYQGGEIINANSSDPFLEVGYKDAHAWSEVWIGNRWHRVDPTAAVSSERLDYGMEALLQLWNDDIFGSSDVANALSDYLNPSGSSRYLRQLRDSWKSIAFQWNKWVVNYDAKTQLELLKNLGFKHGNHLLTLTILLVASASILLLFYFLRLVPKPIKRSQEQALYLKFVKQFKKLGLTKEIAETPNEFALRASQVAPSRKAAIEQITSEYLVLRYGLSPTENSLKSFQKHVRAFKLKKTKQNANADLSPSL